MAERKKSTFEILNEINVNEHTEKKNGLTYLSWAWAWAEVKKRFPDANYVIYESTLPNGCVTNYFTDGRTCYVKTGVIIDGIEHIEDLPVMDYRNKSIPYESVTSFDVNKAIQRSLTKAVARHGLGLYIYAGEDLPESDSSDDNNKPVEDKNEAEIITPQMVKSLQAAIDNHNLDALVVQAIIGGYGYKDISEIKLIDYMNIVNDLKGAK
jgi:hypothetical protein